MTSINPIFVYEIIKNKVGWDPKLTPVVRISDFLETFNSSNNKTLILNGSNILKNAIPVCGNNNLPSNYKTNIYNSELQNIGDNIKTVVSNVKPVCLLNGKDLIIQIDLFGFNNPLSDNQNITDLLSNDKLQNAVKKLQKYATINLGKDINQEPNKKDVLGLLQTLLLSEYNKLDAKNKDGNLKQQVIANQIGLMISDGQKYIELIDVTNANQDTKLCEMKDMNVNNTMNVTNITKYSMLDDGKTFCVDVEMKTNFAQNRIQTINTTDKSNMSYGNNNKKQIAYGDRKEMMSSAKSAVLDSYVAGLLDQVYKMKDKYNVEIMRPTDTTILVKVTDKQSKEVFFNKIDITNAVSDSGTCGEEQNTSRIREYISVDRYCKSGNSYKVAFNVTGSEYTNINSLKIPFAKLQESKDAKFFEEYIKSLHSVTKKVNQKFKPRSAIVFLNSPWNYFAGRYGGVYGLGLYGAGLYGYPTIGYGGAYGYPYGYGGVYGSSFVYTPPLVSSIVPTAPVLSSPLISTPVVAAPYVSSPLVSAYSSVAPLTYSYPAITTSSYTLGSYYSPYAGYGYSYASPFGSPYSYTYTTPYTFVKSEEKRVKLDKEDVLPSEASSYNDLVNLLNDFSHKYEIEKLGSKLVKVTVEKNFIRETHYYEFDEGRIYLTDEHDYQLFI